jgi:hypothetical protein
LLGRKDAMAPGKMEVSRSIRVDSFQFRTQLQGKKCLQVDLKGEMTLPFFIFSSAQSVF